MTVYASCEAQYNGASDNKGNATANGSEEDTTLLMLDCISRTLEQSTDSFDTNVRDFFLVYAGALIFFMQAGFAMVCAGAVRHKNVQNTMLKNLLDACGAALAFYVVGYALAFGNDDYPARGGDPSVEPTDDPSHRSFIGTSNFASVGPSASYWFFQYTLSATSVTIVAGTLAERCQMAAYLWYSVVLAGFVYPVVAHSVWSQEGFLSHALGGSEDTANSNLPLFGVGAIDFAGSGVVHLTGGATALVATLILGPRTGRFYDSDGTPCTTPRDFPGHSIALQLLGTMILWFGWFGFNPGSALILGIDEWGDVAATAAANTALSGAAGGIVALGTQLWLVERRTGEPEFSILHAMNGALSGCVAITAGCGIVAPYAAVVIGGIAGWIYIGASTVLIQWKIDDAVDAIPVHMCNGIWGLVSTGLFAEPQLMLKAYGTNAYPGLFYGLASKSPNTGNLFGCQITAITFILGWVVVTMLPFFVWLNYKGWLRSEALEEIVGLDISYHGSDFVGSEGGGIKKEYIEAFNRQRILRNERTILNRSRYRFHNHSKHTSISLHSTERKDTPKPAAITTANIVTSTTSNPGTGTTASYTAANNHIVHNDRYGNTREKQQLMDAYGNIDTERRQGITNTSVDPNLSNRSDGVVPGSNTNSNDFDYADEDATPHQTN